MSTYAVVLGKDHQVITLFGFAVQRETAEDARGGFDGELEAQVAVQDEVRNTTVFT